MTEAPRTIRYRTNMNAISLLRYATTYYLYDTVQALPHCTIRNKTRPRLQFILLLFLPPQNRRINMVSVETSEVQQQQQQQRYSKFSLLSPTGWLLKRDGQWDSLRQEIAARVPELSAADGTADILKHAFIAGVQDQEVLTSLAALAIQNSQQGSLHYNYHVMTLAKYLASNSCTAALVTTKPKTTPISLACIRALITPRTPVEAGWQLHETVLEDTLRFIVDRSCHEWEYVEHSDQILLWELRAICLMELDSRKQAVLRKISSGGDMAAGFISRQAVRIEKGVILSTACLTAGIEGAGENSRRS